MKKNVMLFIFILMGCFLFTIEVKADGYNNINLPFQLTPDLFRFSDSNPFWIKIGSTKYYLMRTRADGNYTYKDCLGYDITKKRLFEPLFDLESDGDSSKITSAELAKAGIRFVALGNGGSLQLSDKSQDYPLENIAYIDMNKLTVSSRSSIRPYGSFAMYVKTDRGSLKKYIGHVDYQRPVDLQRLF